VNSNSESNITSWLAGTVWLYWSRPKVNARTDCQATSTDDLAISDVLSTDEVKSFFKFQRRVSIKTDLSRTLNTHYNDIAVW